jgi:cyclase
MLNPRIIPCLLIHKNGLVKTKNFKNPKYVGDPINAVRIFNEKQVDELIVIDIDATVNNQEPNYNLIEKLAYECRMPLCYGGGIKNAKQALQILSLGVEKISLSSAALDSPQLVKEISNQVGSQSVVVVLDIKKKFLGGYDIYTKNASNKIKTDLSFVLKKFQELGAGEFVLNSIDNDGMKNGYDVDLISKVKKHIRIPLTVLGGAGSLDDIGEMIRKFGIIGCAAGSLFVFKGKYNAVLINYPNTLVKKEIFK